jgi:O-acetyl-ADP-ribose deacetylase (regulator of RNase III)
MNQQERRLYLINELLGERRDYEDIEIPMGALEQKRLLRSLFNVRMPRNTSEEFLEVQDKYLQEEALNKGITSIDDLEPVEENIYLWQGDITTLKCDAIVNAANSQMLGCFHPCHGCIDNAIHTYAGIQLRQECYELMKEQGHEEPTGSCKITKGYNIPCEYVLHTVGPIIYGALSSEDCELLRSCYESCLEVAADKGLESVAFCCISTGEFHFPNDRAAEIAVETVRGFNAGAERPIKVIFNVFKDLDLEIYQNLLK